MSNDEQWLEDVHRWYYGGTAPEQVARAMLAKDAPLRSAFERRLREDPEFAKSPQARLDYFYRRHSAYDTRYLLYPVMRIDTPLR